jgi:SAM-dependent methyltransferase
VATNTTHLLNYISFAPLPLAFERTLECRIYSRYQFQRPILDLGCGDGLFAKILFADKIDTGVDLNPRELERARELGIYGEVIQCSGDAVPKLNGAYSTIFSNSVLEHIPNLQPVLYEMHRLLMLKGKFFVTVPSERFDDYSVINQLLTNLKLDKAAAGYRRIFNRFWMHYHYYSLEEWEQLFKKSGFRVVEAHEYNPKSICLLNDLLAPLSIVGFLCKRLTNRWTWAPWLRRFAFYPIYLLARRFLHGGERAINGGLVFLVLTKDSHES